MKHWFNRNYKAIIIAAFLIPIITVAIVSISHVTMWYGLSNPLSWAVYLSIGIEIAALSALAAISANMGSKVYFPFIVVTLIQFIGNIFFAYSYIDIDSKTFTDWVDLVSPLLEFIGVEADDLVSHKRFLSLFAGGMLPIISLSFLHMLVKFTEEDRIKEEILVENEHKTMVDNHIIEDEIEKYKKEHEVINASDLMGEISRVRLSENDLKILEYYLSNPPKPNQHLKEAVQRYKESINNGEITVQQAPPTPTPTVTSHNEIEENETLDGSGSSIDDDIDNNDFADNLETFTINEEESLPEESVVNNDVEPLVEESINEILEDEVIPLPEDFIPEPEDLGLFEPNEDTLSDLPNEIEKKN